MHIMAIENNKNKIFWSSLACLLLILSMLVDVGLCQTGGGVASIVSSDVFNSIVGGASSGCAGIGFYNYDSFVNVANAFNGFGTSGSSDVNKREVDAFFANAAHETGGFCYIEEQNPGSIYCDTSNTQYPCTPSKSYHGRGPLQLSWNYNYGAAGNNIRFDGLNKCHIAITSGQGFGATIRAINSMECGGGNDATLSSRVNYYQKFCQQLNIDLGSNLRC